MPPPITLTPAEHAALTRQYLNDGAWTDSELKQHLTRPAELLKAEFLVQMHTVMGTLTLLGSAGRKAVFETTEGAVSLQRQLDNAYLRLCLKEKGYVATTPETTRNLNLYAGRMRLVEVMTERGVALAGGTMSSGGITPNGLDNMAVRLRSSALAYGFHVHVFTPQPKLGQAKAAQFRQFLTLETRVPGHAQAQGSRLLLTQLDAQQDRTGDGPFLSRYHALALYDSPDPGLPIPTVDLLLLDKSERRERFFADLAADRVISYGQLRRHYGLDEHDLDRVPYVETVLQPTHMRKALEVKTRFFLGQKSLQSMSDHSLMHFAGTGEMRRILGVRTGDHWRVNPRHVRASEEPDAVFRSPHGEVAVEFDTGTYTMTTIQKKLGAFSDRAFLETVWGVTSINRQRHLREEIGSQLKRDILLADWWSDLPRP
ncbi:hypothetical protein E7T06_10075 [Deinococcus sp. Arct2-2]|uniref:hypothetical protein n=1 Tax=Deinococcus sp. Arct2-2 TaxID=2568653 RepID=UPI0010A361F7|nr:hypothetical protein [Deinococcus sp. Arct2-2]THF69841.1 hypothetical protein E7T06_10075 [Deinococcus sp. Arct2-2]